MKLPFLRRKGLVGKLYAVLELILDDEEISLQESYRFLAGEALLNPELAIFAIESTHSFSASICPFNRSDHIQIEHLQIYDKYNVM